jgi:phosphoadenosine phosphosulfate reductase
LSALVASVAPHVPIYWVRVEPIFNPDCLLVRDAFFTCFPGALERYREVVVGRTMAAGGEWATTGHLERGFKIAAAEAGPRYLAGIRGDESGGRRKRAWRGHAFGVSCAPLLYWAAADVFAYLYAHRLPVHPAYACTRGGLLDRGRIRVATLGGERGTGWGRGEWEADYYRAEMSAIRRATPTTIG